MYNDDRKRQKSNHLRKGGEMHILDITLNEIDVYLTEIKDAIRKIIIELNSILTDKTIEIYFLPMYLTK